MARERSSDALLQELKQLRKREREAARREALFASAEALAAIGSWEVRGEQLLWSDNLYRLYGYEPGEVEPSPQAVFGLTHPDDVARVERTVEILNETGEFPAALEYRIRLSGRGVRHLRATLAVLEKRDGRPSRMIGSVFDITDQRRAEREIAAHVAVAHALAEWESLDQGAGLLLRNLAAAIEFDGGVLWLPADGVLVARVFCHTGVADVASFETATRACRFRPGAGLPGRAWSEKEPISCLNAAEDAGFRRRDAAIATGVRGAIAFPALQAEEVLAVLELFSSDEALLPNRLMRSFTGIGYEVGRFLAGRRGELGPAPLTARELEVLQLAARGLTGPQIAHRLGVTSATVKTHLAHIYERLEVSDRASAVACALRRGLID